MLLGPEGAPGPHNFLFFYVNPNISEPSREIFAARHGPYKIHWRTSPGLLPHGGGDIAPVLEHDPPLVFHVEEDPSEAYPLGPADLPAGFYERVATALAAEKRALRPRAIDPAWGYPWALCCGYGCVPPCQCTCENRTVELPACSHPSG